LKYFFSLLILFLYLFLKKILKFVRQKNQGICFKILVVFFFFKFFFTSSNFEIFLQKKFFSFYDQILGSFFFILDISYFAEPTKKVSSSSHSRISSITESSKNLRQLKNLEVNFKKISIRRFFLLFSLKGESSYSFRKCASFSFLRETSTKSFCLRETFIY